MAQIPRYVQIEEASFHDWSFAAYADLIDVAPTHLYSRKAVACERQVESNDAVKSENGDDMHG